MNIADQIREEITAVEKQMDELKTKIKHSVKTAQPYQDDNRKLVALHDRLKVLQQNLSGL